MNILASYNWIKEYLETDLSAEEFAKRTTAAGNSVERMQRLPDTYARMVIGVVKELRAHPSADKLRVAVTDIGKETVEIVCGGVNLQEGMRVVVALPGARVKWHGQGDFVELVKTKIRGVESHGMICAAEEIGFEKLASGERHIWDVSALTQAKAGTPVVEALELDDVVFDIEVTSNRPDGMSIVGQAREGAAVTGIACKIPNGKIPHSKQIPNSKFEIQNKEPMLCPKYSAILIDNVKVAPSPWWLQKKLLLAGHRPINNMVDITNLILHEYGQPLHAFDADKIEGGKIIVRRAKKHEKFLALDGKTYALGSEMLVIADAKKAVAVAGVMGGEATGVTERTTRVLIECATFEPVSVRKTARTLNLYSDSQLLFEKGLSTQATGPAIERAIELMCEVAGGTLVSDVMVEEAKPYEPRVFDFDPEAARRLMGVDLPDQEMLDILQRLGFTLSSPTPPNPPSGRGGIHRITVPYWRDHDIEHSVDFTEEIARVYGYDRFPSVLPSGELPVGRMVPALDWSRRIKRLLCGMGMSEIYSYSFVSENELERYGIKLTLAVKLRNPLSTDLEYMRPSLVPSMLTTIEQNQARFPSARLFELAPVYLSVKGDLPEQPLRLLMAVYGKDGREAFLSAKGSLERLCRETGIGELTMERTADPERWHQGRSATLRLDKKIVGTIGQVSDQVTRAFKLDVKAVLVELDFEALVSVFTSKKAYTPIPAFPSVKRDLAFVVSERVEYAAVVERIKHSSVLLEQVDLFDVYRGKGMEEGQPGGAGSGFARKSVALHFSFRSGERTLESKEVDVELEIIRGVLQKEFGAIMRS